MGVIFDGAKEKEKKDVLFFGIVVVVVVVFALVKRYQKGKKEGEK